MQPLKFTVNLHKTYATYLILTQRFDLVLWKNVLQILLSLKVTKEEITFYELYYEGWFLNPQSKNLFYQNNKVSKFWDWGNRYWFILIKWYFQDSYNSPTKWKFILVLLEILPSVNRSINSINPNNTKPLKNYMFLSWVFPNNKLVKMSEKSSNTDQK